MKTPKPTKPFERKNVRALREALGWTQRELSEYLGSAPSFTVPNWENPKNANGKIRGYYSRKLWELWDFLEEYGVEIEQKND